MREIKFKWICEFWKDFVYGSLIITKIWNWLNEDWTWRNINKYSIKDDNGTIFDNIKSETIWQYTWLKDKNWKESFEWDVFIYNDKKYVIKYHDTFAWFYWETLDWKWIYKYDCDLEWFDDCEIIWNIYEDSNLLDNKEND